MNSLFTEHSDALRHAIILRDYTAELLNRDAVHGVEFGDVREEVETLFVSYPQADHLLGTGRPSHVPAREADAGLHVLTLLAVLLDDLNRLKTIRLVDAVNFLQRFYRLADDLVHTLQGTRP